MCEEILGDSHSAGRLTFASPGGCSALHSNMSRWVSASWLCRRAMLIEETIGQPVKAGLSWKFLYSHVLRRIYRVKIEIFGLMAASAN